MRRIDEIIIHCSATPEGQDVTTADIEGWHRQRGFRSIGYHYVIYLDGSVHRGRAEEQKGAHCRRHNDNSIGICYVGGCDKRMKPKDTRTTLQTAALVKLIRDLKARYPGATVHGHYEFENKACPCFDVGAWWKEVSQ